MKSTDKQTIIGIVKSLEETIGEKKSGTCSEVMTPLPDKKMSDATSSGISLLNAVLRSATKKSFC